CCEGSCVDGLQYLCGTNGFDCLDPAFTFDPEVIAEFPYCAGEWPLIGDGSCSAANNNALCGYDGGDVSPSMVSAMVTLIVCTVCD
ncbi:unnamed protein product, partial [Hapterophycus canaliculatus]